MPTVDNNMVLDVMETPGLHEKLALLPSSAIQKEMWLRGDLQYLTFKGGQRAIYNFIHGWKAENPNLMGPLVVEAHRGLGKSFLLLLLAFEAALRYPYQNVRYGGPTFKDTLQITQHNRGKLLRLAPDGLVEDHPERIVIRNPRWGNKKAVSEIFFFGANRDTIDNQRGLRSNVIIADEIGYFDDAEYAVSDVLSFHTVMQEHALMLLSSTPPPSQGHLWCTKFVPEAKSEKRYICMNVLSNPDFRPEDEERLVAIVGGKNTTAWRREALCEHVSDEHDMVVPEFLHRRADIVKEVPKPTHCYQLAGADFGFKDATAVLFAYWDFREQKMVIEDEVVRHHLTTRKVSELIKAKEEEHFHWVDKQKTRERPLWNQTRRVADGTLQQLEDLSVDFQLFFEPAEKQDRDAKVADFRSAIDAEKILINPRCVVLIHQLGAGIYNKSRRDFERQIGEPEHGLLLGHLDAIAAAVYLWSFAKKYAHYNPFPHGVYDMHNTVVTRLPKGENTIQITRNPLAIHKVSF